ncbi:UbiA family prenyltransferase [Nocardioidaceae bacterium]|nr:UbiA family prenyltransferase [Nocardioidaceae bacterium]
MSTTATGSHAAEHTGEKSPEDHSQLLGLLWVARPVPAAAFAAAIALVAAISGRTALGVLLAAAAAFTGQLLLAVLNDVADRRTDREVGRPGKPVADGRLIKGNATFMIALLVLLVVPLSLTNGTLAGLFHLGFLAVAAVGTFALRASVLSPLPWAASYALLPFFLSYGGVGGGTHGSVPTTAAVVLAALLGVGVHFLRALPDLVADHRGDVTHLPLRLGLRIGATRLLAATVVYVALVTAGLAYVLLGPGLGR